MNEQDFRKLFPMASQSTLARNRNFAAGGVASHAVHEQAAFNESLAEEKGKGPDPVRRLVRFTSYRVSLADERNLEDKYFTDALRYAGILYQDTPQWAKIEVIQEKVDHHREERTVIEVA